MFKRSDLHNYQLRAIEKVKSQKGTGLFIDMGLGKTTSTLTATMDILDDFEINKFLIIAPLRVANTVWHNEAKNWEHLKELGFSIVTGSEKERIAALKEENQYYVINRENLPWLVDYYKSKWPFDGLAIDESSSFKNPTSKRFRALKKVLKYIKKRIILTGTPSPNGYMDLWSQIFILDDGEALGTSITRFRNTYFDKDFMGFNYTLKEGAAERIQDKIKHLVISMQTADYLNLPEFIPSVIDVPLPSALLKKYKAFEEDMIMAINSEDKITAVSAAALSNKLLQFSSGAVYDEDGTAHHFHDLKFDALDEIMEENPNDNFLIAYNFKHEKERLLKRYPEAVLIDKEGKAVKDWNEGKIKMLLAHPASAGHGLNLQHGGSLLIWLGFNWSLELYQQFNKRLHRQGQKEVVRAMHIAVGDVEYRLMRSLAKKDITQDELLKALK